jgi:hypothetical protein
MKKKSARDIPDFSHKRPPSKTPRTPDSADSGNRSAQPKNPVNKPWSTSSKSGRRGQ